MKGNKKNATIFHNPATGAYNPGNGKKIVKNKALRLLKNKKWRYKNE